MESPSRRDAENQLALMELLQIGQEHRHAVMDAVWDAQDEDEAVERLRGLLGTTADPRVILDLRLGRLTADRRERLSVEVNELRRLLQQD